MNDFIDIYCERLGPGFWAEPVNALTNFAFFIAAFCAWRLTARENRAGWQTFLLPFLILVIGTGSFLFHTLAVLWAMLGDSLPILIYQIAFIYLYTRRVMVLPPKDSLALLGLFVASIYVFGQVPKEVLNGSVSYAPALLFLGGFALWHREKAAREPETLLLAAAIFLVSLAFRSLDIALCPAFPLGVHFLWHILNGGVLYLTARAYILNARNS